MSDGHVTNHTKHENSMKDYEKPTDLTGFVLLAVGMVFIHVAALIAITIHELTKH